MKTIKVDIKELKTLYPHREWPCLSYCKKLLKEKVDPDSRLEVWNYERTPPEADWIVPNIGEYCENVVITYKNGRKYHPPSIIE